MTAEPAWASLRTYLAAEAGGRPWLFRPGVGWKEVPQTVHPFHLGDIAALAETAHPAVIHLHPSVLELLGLPTGEVPTAEQAAEVLGGAAADGWETGPLEVVTRLRRQQDRWTVLVAASWWETGTNAQNPHNPYGGWHRYPAKQAAAGLELFARTTGRAFEVTTGQTVEWLAEAQHPRRKGGVQLEAVTLPEAVWEVSERPYSWRRPLNRLEAEMGFVHVYDANAAYLSAWSVTELGLGEPVHMLPPFAVGTEVLKDPGVWRLEEPLQGVPGGALPPPWYEQTRQPLYTSPTLLRALEAGYPIPAAVEGWSWPTHTRYLRGAAEVLRDARSALLYNTDPGAPAALEHVKRCYHAQTGRLESRRLEVHNEASGWRRPDWAWLIIAQARANLHRRLSKLTAAPFAVDVDALAFTSEVPDPAAHAAAIGLPIGSGLGQYRAYGSLELDEPVRTLISGTRTGSRLVQGLGRLASERVSS